MILSRREILGLSLGIGAGEGAVLASDGGAAFVLFREGSDLFVRFEGLAPRATGARRMRSIRARAVLRSAMRLEESSLSSTARRMRAFSRATAQSSRMSDEAPSDR